jgi:hypothetical protein
MKQASARMASKQYKCVAYIARHNRVCGAAANKRHVAERLLSLNARAFRTKPGTELYGQTIVPAEEGHYLCTKCASYCEGRSSAVVTVPPETREHEVSNERDVVLHWSDLKRQRIRPTFSIQHWYYTPAQFSSVYCDDNIPLVRAARPTRC